jgi:hypothetical protein
LVPIHCLANARSIARSGGKILGDSASVVEAEHFKTHCGTSSSGNQVPEHFGLELMMVGVVVPLAEQDEIRASQTFDQTLAIDESLGGDVPDTSRERMISTQR